MNQPFHTTAGWEPRERPEAEATAGHDPPATTSEVLRTDTPQQFAEAVRRAADCLRAGELVALPTETVYGLAAPAGDASAVARIFAAKGRPRHNPLIVHVASVAMARSCTTRWTALAGRLARAFWPGPLTLVLPTSRRIAAPVTAGGGTVAVRWPAHPVIQAVIRACGFPLAAPSANRANAVSPTTAEHVRDDLGPAVSLILDGGPCAVGIESTVLDLTGSAPAILRPGMITAEALGAVLGALPVSAAATPGTAPLRSPGRLPRHYAPRTPLHLLAWRDKADLRRQLRARGLAPGRCHVIAHTRLPDPPGFAGVDAIPQGPEAFARALYAALHRADRLGAAALVVERPPATPAWHAIADRLERAATRTSCPASGRR
ncbi:MAG TPA: L-threonylcarbamoyladenylate synthase [Verrucomicrobiota bacterium]|nr:L-threonylcarbamoyladenylate synthase [Verrucomicrobiota bacterium]HNU52204.1 L-threonylcarbamoyladenylate synthase [Verrucomicrobiota bacterium]